MRITLSDIVKIYVNIGIHESGHMTGLVAEDYLDGGYNDHNPINDAKYIMNHSNVLFLDLDRGIIKQFTVDNILYLKFTLPKP